MICRTLRFGFIGSFLATSLLFAGHKQHAWHNAKVLDTAQAARLIGFTGGSQTSGNTSATVNTFGNTASAMGQSSQQTSSHSEARYIVNENYAFDDGQYIYYTSEPLRFVWSKPAHLVVNGSTQISVERDKLFVVDQDGKQHETRIVKQIAKT